MSAPGPAGIEAAADSAQRAFPFAWFVPLLTGAATAFLFRVAFMGRPGEAYSAMLGAFIFLVPALCGAVTVASAAC